MNQEGTLVTADKPGYFPGSRMFFPVEGDLNRIKIKLVPEAYIYNFEASSGGTIITNGEATLTFPPNAIVRESDQNPYDGLVEVAFYWMDPRNPQTCLEMPGNLLGVDEENALNTLGTLGMVQVELRDSEGQKLNLQEGSTASIFFPIEEPWLSTLPEVVPMWTYVDGPGLWSEEGQADRITGGYQAEVAHFSTWNCGLSFDDFILLSGEFVHPDIDVINNLVLQIQWDNGTLSTSTFLGNNGTFYDLVPKNQEITINLYDDCNEIVSTFEVGPFSEDTDLGSIFLDPTSPLLANYTLITGSVVDCDFQPVSQYILSVFVNPELQLSFYSEEPNFAVWTPLCDNPSFDFIAVDYGTTISSGLQTFQGASQVDVGQLVVCNTQPPSFFTFTANGSSFTYSPLSYAYGGVPDTLYLSIPWGGGTSGSVRISNYITAPTGVHYDSHGIYVFHADSSWSFTNQVADTFIITQAGTLPGDTISGYFSGEFFNEESDSFEITSGNFHHIIQ